MRTLFLVGRSEPRILELRAIMAWCRCCNARRLIRDIVTWRGWPEGEAPTTGTCSKCGNTVSVVPTPDAPTAA